MNANVQLSNTWMSQTFPTAVGWGARNVANVHPFRVSPEHSSIKLERSMFQTRPNFVHPPEPIFTRTIKFKTKARLGGF